MALGPRYGRRRCSIRTTPMLLMRRPILGVVLLDRRRRRPSRAAPEAGLPIQTPQRSPYRGRGEGGAGTALGLDTDDAYAPQETAPPPASSYSASAPVFRRRPSRAAPEAEPPIQTLQRSPYRGQRPGWGWDGANLDTDAAVITRVRAFPQQRPIRSARLSFAVGRVGQRWRQDCRSRRRSAAHIKVSGEGGAGDGARSRCGPGCSPGA